MVQVHAGESKLRSCVTTTGRAKARRQDWTPETRYHLPRHSTDLVCSFHCQIIDCYDLNEWLTIVRYNRFSPITYHSFPPLFEGWWGDAEAEVEDWARFQVEAAEGDSGFGQDAVRCREHAASSCGVWGEFSRVELKFCEVWNEFWPRFKEDLVQVWRECSLRRRVLVKQWLVVLFCVFVGELICYYFAFLFLIIFELCLCLCSRLTWRKCHSASCLVDRLKVRTKCWMKLNR